MATPYVTTVHNVVPSTQDLAVAGLQNTGRPSLVVAHAQTAGRGRSGNEWLQATRGIAASLALEVDDVADTFTLGVGLAVRTAIRSATGIDTQLKWPNDIEVSGRKVGGILVERSGASVVVGCGLNLYWPDPPLEAVALFDDDPGSEIGVTLSEAWATIVCETGAAWDRDEYVAASSTLGTVVTWAGGGPGKVLTFDHLGGLVVDTDSGPVTLRSGDVQTLRTVSDDA